MNEWIKLNLPVNRFCNKAFKKLLKESNIKKPNIKKYLGFDPDETLAFFKMSRYMLSYFDEHITYIANGTANKFGLETTINTFKQVNNVYLFSKNPNCINTFNSNILSEKELNDTFNKFQLELNNLEKIAQYLSPNYYKDLKDQIINYNNLTNNLKRESKFYTCKYNKPGYLVNLINEKTNKIYSYLIGTDSTIDKFFEKETKDLIVIRVKKVVEDEELLGVHIFE